MDVSIFLNFTFWEMLQNAFDIIVPSSSLVEVIVHERALRSHSNEFQSVLSICKLRLSALEQEDENEPFGYSKVGGIPFIYREKRNVTAKIKQVLDEGFIHFAQLATPLIGDIMLGGNWPFGDGFTQLFVKTTEKFEWRCIWQYET